MTNGIAVSLTVGPRYAGGIVLRIRSKSVTSASSKLVTCGMVLADLTIWAAMVRRIADIRSRRTWP